MGGYYAGDFSSNEDIEREFGLGASDLDGCDILFAAYEYEDYEGSAFVVFRKDGRLWSVDAGHCSCHGLDEQGYSGDGKTQWEPEATTVKALRMREFYSLGHHKAALLAAIGASA